MKMYKFWLKFHLSLFPGVQFIIFQPGWYQAIIWINDRWITDTYMGHSASMS